MTEEQRTAVLDEIIEAYQNGKRLSDLPDVSGTNPFDLYCEVLDVDGESKKAALATLLPYLEDQCAYGVEFDTTVSSPTCTRIGNAALHKSLPIQSLMRGCLLDDDGKVVEYLNPKDWTGNTRDGSRGQVMVELPLFYWKFEEEGTKRRVKLSLYPLAGYAQVPKRYVSAYEATVQRSANKLASVVNLTADYRGGNNNSANDGQSNSSLGRPATVISRTNYRNYARNRKSGSTQWNAYTYGVHKELYWLFVVEYATLNSQAEFNAQLTSEGYRQGGLGAGVTTIDGTKWSAFNGYYPFIPCGHSDSLGNGTGYVEYTMPAEYDETQPKVQVNRYRGVELPFGHIFKFADGINVRISPTEENGGDNRSKVFVCDDPAKFSDTGYDGYRYVGDEARADGYGKEHIFGEEGAMIPSAVGGGSTTYMCDKHFTNIPATETLRAVLFGGDAHHGAGAGFGCASSYHAPSYTYAHNGSRLCFIP